MEHVDDYYSYKPRVQLARPVALVGFPGSNAMQTARVAGMITGIQVLMLPRAVSHITGMDPEGLLLQGRHAELHAAELEVLQQTLSMRSKPVLALGATTLEDPSCRAFLEEQAELVHLRQSLPDAVACLLVEMQNDRRKHQHLTAHGELSEAGLAPIYALRTGLYQRLCTVQVDLAGRAPLDVGKSLPGLLGW